MKRSLYKELITWKNKNDRMPLILLGARQVGKTYLLQEFGQKEYLQLHVFNFQEKPELKRIFKKNLDPHRIIQELAISQKRDININHDLVFFDEIQECSEAVSSLKYFCDKLPQLNLVAAGSLLGVTFGATSFPVGKVERLHLYPMSFAEYIDASGDATAKQVFWEKSRLISAHEVLWEYGRNYFFTGGMPRCVAKWFSEIPIVQRINEIRRIQNDIVSGYENDFTKHSGKINALHIIQVLNSLPGQLAAVQDDSVKRFRFANVIPGKRSYIQLSGPISWLENAGLIYKVHPIECEPKLPLKAYCKENIFKLFLFDVGLLGAMLGLSYHDLINHEYGMVKGFFAENFVGCELIASGITPLFSWTGREAEIEFLYVTADSCIVPVEVKSGKRTHAQSLKSYMQRYHPKKTVKLIGAPGGCTDDGNLALPLYFAGRLSEFLESCS